MQYTYYLFFRKIWIVSEIVIIVILYTFNKCNSRSMHDLELIHHNLSGISALDFFSPSKPIGVSGILVSAILACFHNSGFSHSKASRTGRTKVVNFPCRKKWEIDPRYHSKIRSDELFGSAMIHCIHSIAFFTVSICLPIIWLLGVWVFALKFSTSTCKSAEFVILIMA